MPIARFETPDGRIARFEVPEGTAPEQAMKAAEQYFAGFGRSNEYSVANDSSAGKVMSALDKVEATPYIGPVVKGVRDVTKGGAQLLAHGINAVAPSILPDDELRNIDNDVRVSEQKYQAARQARMPQSITSLVTGEQTKPGIDWGRLGGSIIATAPISGVGAATIPATIAKGVGIGAGIGALNPVTSEGNFAGDKTKQVLLGGLGGGVGSAAAAGLSRIIRPNTSPEVKALIEQGVTPTPGQIIGGPIARFEEKLTSVPILGDAIKGGQNRALDQFNTAAYNRALNPIGKVAGPEIGRDGVKGVKDALTNAYDDLLPKLQFKADTQFSNELGNLLSMTKNGNVPPQIATQFENILKNDVISRMTKQGAMDGQSFKQLETALGQKIKSFKGSPDPNAQMLGDALSEVLSSARSVLSRSNPQHADQLSKINQGYAAYARIRDAASRVGAQEGVFSPGQLQAAVRAGDKSVGKGKFATGDALLQDLSEAGKTVLGSKYPDSGTAGRLMAGPGIGAALGASNPLLMLGVGAATLPYTAMGQNAIAKALTQRPAIADPIANSLLSASPLLGAATGGGLIGLYGPSAP